MNITARILFFLLVVLGLSTAGLIAIRYMETGAETAPEDLYGIMTNILLGANFLFVLLALFFLRFRLFPSLISLPETAPHITEAASAKEALHNSEERFKGLFENAGVSIWNEDLSEICKTLEKLRRDGVTDLRQYLEENPQAARDMVDMVRIIQVNDATLKLFGGNTSSEFIPQIDNIFTSESIKIFINELCAIWDKKKVFHSEANFKTLKGETINVLISYRIPQTREGFKSLAVCIIDITQHKLADEQLRKLSIAVEQSPTSIIITDAEGVIEYVNPKFETTTGYAAADVIGQYNQVFNSKYITEKDQHKLWETITSGKQWRGEFHYERQDGSLFWEFITISPITTKDNIITHFLVLMEDITDRRRFEGHFRRSQKMEAIGQLAGGIAHDFNNLLGIIIGNLDLMNRKVSHDETLQSRLEKAQNAALRGSALTRRLLNFSQQSPEASSPVNINKIILSLEDLISKSLTKKILLETNLANDLWMVEINTGDFEDMLVNLALNARDAMPNGGRLIIETRNTRLNEPLRSDKEDIQPGEYVEIAISDTGAGMSKNIVPKIFDPFFTTKEKDKGTGLGLTMVYSFIQRSKGHISAYSEKAVGTTFRIYLPRAVSMSDHQRHAIASDEALPGGTETILIVDDEEELTLIAKTILEKLGYTTLCAYGADEALQILEKTPDIDLLFSDVIMGGSLNGFELAKTAVKIRPKLKILLTSGFAGKMQNSDIIEKWEKRLMTKPYREKALTNQIRRTLDEED